MVAVSSTPSSRVLGASGSHPSPAPTYLSTETSAVSDSLPSWSLTSSLEERSPHKHCVPAVSHGHSPQLTELLAAPRQLPSVGLSLASGSWVSPDPSSFVSDQRMSGVTSATSEMGTPLSTCGHTPGAMVPVPTPCEPKGYLKVTPFKFKAQCH